jgi:HSP20 family protein
MTKDNTRELARCISEIGFQVAEKVGEFVSLQGITGRGDLSSRIMEKAEVLWSERIPAVRITQGKESFTVEAQVSGYDFSDLEVVVLDDTVTIRGERSKDVASESNSKVIVDEFKNYCFDRSVKLPEVVDAQKVAAEMKNGILKVTLGRRSGQSVTIKS